MTRPASPAAPQPGAPADARPSWAQPLRVHLGVAMVALLVAVAGTIIAFDYASRRGAAVADATLEMQEFADRLVERYQVLADDPVIFADLAAIADVFLEPPPSGLPAKIAYLRTLTAQAPQVDGAFAGYPDGAAIYLTDLRRSQAWRRALDPRLAPLWRSRSSRSPPMAGARPIGNISIMPGSPSGGPRPRRGMTRGQGPGIAWQRTARSSS